MLIRQSVVLPAPPSRLYDMYLVGGSNWFTSTCRRDAWQEFAEDGESSTGSRGAPA
jgi:hypothetical protein